MVLIQELLHLSAQKLKAVTDVPQKEAMLLLANVLNKELSWIIAHSHDVVDVNAAFWEKVQRRSNHEPLEYILGQASFYGREFDVDARVLIPRPETEILVDYAMELARELEHPHIVEIGCGSGVISIMLARMLQDVTLTAVDISKEALHVSKHNASKHHVEDRICLVEGSYLDSVEGKIDMIVSNPPYIAKEESLGLGLAYEPSLALFGGDTGDEMLKHIIDLFLLCGAKRLVCEMGYNQRKAIMEYSHQKGLEVSFYKDLAGLDRGFWIRKDV